MSDNNTYGLTTMNAMLTSQDCICHCPFSPANEMSDNNTYGLTTMNAMLTSQIVSLTVCSVQLMK